MNEFRITPCSTFECSGYAKEKVQWTMEMALDREPLCMGFASKLKSVFWDE